MAAPAMDHEPGATSDPVGDVTSNGGAGAQSSAQDSSSTTTTTRQQEKYSHLVSSGAGGDSSVQRSTPDFLVLVLDCNPFGWAAAAAEGGRGGSGSGSGSSSAAAELERTLRDVLIFLNAHLALQHDNGVAVYAAAGGQAQLLFSTASHSAPFRFGLDSEDGEEEEDDEGRKPDANSFQHFRALDAQVFRGVRSLLKQAARVMGDEVQEMLDEAAGNAMDVDQANGREDGQAEKKRQRMGATGIVSALAQALCHIHRVNLTMLAPSGSAVDTATATSIARSTDSSSGRPGAAESAASAAGRAFRSRILILSVTPDASSQYVAMMNAIFGAQKSLIPINVYKIYGEDSVFLQQASHLTNGNYLRADGRQGLLQVLLTAFLPSRSIASLVHLPNQDEVDFRAACFCHRKIVDVGYVCSVCLSIFCEPIPHCTTCRSRFPRKTLQRFQADHKLLDILGISSK